MQNEREWQQLCSAVLGQAGLAKDARFCRPDLRVANRAVLDDIISAVTATLSREDLLRTLNGAGVACAAVNSVKDLVEHPQLSTVQYHTSTGHLATVPAPPVTLASNGHRPPALPDVPTIGQHSAAIRAEFGN